MRATTAQPPIVSFIEFGFPAFQYLVLPWWLKGDASIRSRPASAWLVMRLARLYQPGYRTHMTAPKRRRAGRDCETMFCRKSKHLALNKHQHETWAVRILLSLTEPRGRWLRNGEPQQQSHMGTRLMDSASLGATIPQLFRLSLSTVMGRW